MTDVKIGKQVLSIQVELGMMVMSLLVEADIDGRTQEMTVQTISMMQAKVSRLLDLSVDDVKAVWKEVKCGIRDMRSGLTPDEASELAEALMNGEEGQA